MSWFAWGLYCYREEALNTVLWREEETHEVSVPCQAPRERTSGRSRWSYHAEVLYGIKRPKQSLWSHMLAVGQSSGRMLPSISPWSRAGWWGRRKWEAMRSSHGISGLGPQWQRKPPARPTFLTDWAAAARHPSYRWGLQTVTRGHMWDL